MGHTTVRSTVSIPLVVANRCSRCKQITANIYNITEVSEAVRHGNIQSRRSIAAMKRNASSGAENIMGRRLGKISDEAKMHRYRAAELNCKCTHCGHKEAWSKMRYSGIESVIGYITAPALIISIVALLAKDFSAFFVIFGSLCALIGVWYLLKNIHRHFIEKKIGELPPDSLPSISLYTPNSNASQTNIGDV